MMWWRLRKISLMLILNHWRNNLLIIIAAIHDYDCESDNKKIVTNFTFDAWKMEMKIILEAREENHDEEIIIFHRLMIKIFLLHSHSRACFILRN